MKRRQRAPRGAVPAAADDRVFQGKQQRGMLLPNPGRDGEREREEQQRSRSRAFPSGRAFLGEIPSPADPWRHGWNRKTTPGPSCPPQEGSGGIKTPHCPSGVGSVPAVGTHTRGHAHTLTRVAVTQPGPRCCPLSPPQGTEVAVPALSFSLSCPSLLCLSPAAAPACFYGNSAGKRGWQRQPGASLSPCHQRYQGHLWAPPSPWDGPGSVPVPVQQDGCPQGGLGVSPWWAGGPPTNTDSPERPDFLLPAGIFSSGI